MAVYEIDTDDIDAVLDALKGTAVRGGLTMSGAIDTAASVSVVYEKLGEEVGVYHIIRKAAPKAWWSSEPVISPV